MTMSDFNHGWHSSLHENLSNPEVLKCFTKWQLNKSFACHIWLADLKSCDPGNSHFAL